MDPVTMSSMLLFVCTIIFVGSLVYPIIESWNLGKAINHVIGFTGFLIWAYFCFFVVSTISNILEIDITNVWCRTLGHNFQDLGERIKEDLSDSNREVCFHLHKCKRCGLETEGGYHAYRDKGETRSSDDFYKDMNNIEKVCKIILIIFFVVYVAISGLMIGGIINIG